MTSYAEFVKLGLKSISKTRKVIFSSDNKFAKTICPNPQHKGGKEGDPSLRINLEETRAGNRKYVIGSGKCFSCGAYYSGWKKILLAFDRPDLIDHGSDPFQFEEEKISSFFVKEESIEEDEDAVLIEDLRGSVPWDKQTEWRSINGELVNEVGGKLYFDSQEYVQDTMLYLPCMVNNKEIGGVRARIVKQGKLNYFNTPGLWVNSIGLYPYDYTNKYLKQSKFDTLALVEGPRDALNSLQYSIPALGVLGSGNWSDTKAELVASLPIKRIITAFDPDEAGERVRNKVYESMKNQFEVRNFNFQHYKTKFDLKGELDPGNMPENIAFTLLKHIKSRSW